MNKSLNPKFNLLLISAVLISLIFGFVPKIEAGAYSSLFYPNTTIDGKGVVIGSTNTNIDGKGVVIGSTNTDIDGKGAVIGSTNTDIGGKGAVIGSSDTDIGGKGVVIGSTNSALCGTGFCPEFNICPEDKKLLRLKNRTQGDEQWKDLISANAGDKVAFLVYYHNGVSNSTAKNTKIRLDFPNLLKTQIVTTAYLWADNASYVSDTGTINVSSPQKLVFENTAKWYPNQGSVATIIPVVEVNPRSIMVEIGDIQGSWAYQGYVVFEASLEPVPITSVDIKANSSNGPITVPYLSNVVISWTSANAVSCQASGDWSGAKAVSGSQSIQMNQVKTYNFTLTCQDSTGTKISSDSVTVNVNPNPPTVTTRPAVATY